MRLQVSEILTLDGVMEAPEQWVFQYMDQEIGEDVMSILGETNAMLFGRKTYQEMAAAWPNRTGGMADIFNSVPKYVVSSTLRDVTWNNSHVITGNVVEEVARLKAQPGGFSWSTEARTWSGCSHSITSSMSTTSVLLLWFWGRESVSFKKGIRPAFNWLILKPTRPGCFV